MPDYRADRLGTNPPAMTYAISGLGFASPYWFLGVTLALAGGTISQVSQWYDTEEYGAISLVVKQSVLLAVSFAAVQTRLIGLLGADPAAIGCGGAYLWVVAAGVAFEFANKVANRTLVGADDAWTPMVVRSAGAFPNIAVNAALIFGADLGVVGAALGTVIATVFVTATFA